MNKDIKQRFDVDPILEKISPHIPDDEIDFLFPFRNFNSQGRVRAFKTSQLYRAHILAMIKEITSFNKLCAEFRSRRSFRDFCRFKNKRLTPTNRILSEFRGYLKASGFEEITRLITVIFLTDMPANCSGFRKKNAHALDSVPAPGNIPRKEQ